MDITGDDIMLTVFLKHDQSQALDEFQAKLDARDWWDRFPPEGVEVVSWYVVMGIGQIATLRLPPSKLQAVNVELERSAWGVFRTEAYPTYDFKPVRERLARESRERRGAAPRGRENASTTAASETVNSGAGGGDHPRLPPNGLFLEEWQSRTREPTDYEQRLGDALEEAFRNGIHDLPDLVQTLNRDGVLAPDGAAWTEDGFVAAMRDLGN